MKSAEEWATVIGKEHERAVQQRDNYILTGVSTASHGGSHDTCFRVIVEQIQQDAIRSVGQHQELLRKEGER